MFTTHQMVKAQEKVYTLTSLHTRQKMHWRIFILLQIKFHATTWRLTMLMKWNMAMFLKFTRLSVLSRKYRVQDSFSGKMEQRASLKGHYTTWSPLCTLLYWVRLQDTAKFTYLLNVIKSSGVASLCLLWESLGYLIFSDVRAISSKKNYF